MEIIFIVLTQHESSNETNSEAISAMLHLHVSEQLSPFTWKAILKIEPLRLVLYLLLMEFIYACYVNVSVRPPGSG